MSKVAENPSAVNVSDNALSLEDGDNLTDVGNAQRFARMHAHHLRYCWPWGKYLTWNSRRWQAGDLGSVLRLAKETVRAMFAHAGEIEDDTRRKEWVKHVLATERAAHLKAMIDLARDELAVLPEDLDRFPMLLNVQNGTLRLDMEDVFCEHDREDFLTSVAPVMFRPGAGCPRWLEFLDTIFERKADLIAFVQELAGYCLTGDVREQVLPILWGSGANGKSVFIGTLMTLLGEGYAIPGPRDLLMTRKGDSHPTSVARLFRKRLVVWQESTEGSRLDEAFVKELTGGDKLTGRRMREDYWSFLPTHKPILVTNHRPEVKGSDHGLWRRIRLVPFNVRIPDEDQDKHLPEKLRGELSGILNWCLEGCRRWQDRGLSLPAEVKAATAEYRDQQDAIGQFVAECCVTGEGYREQAGRLFAAFTQWCERNNEYQGSHRRFGQALKERGFESKPSNGYHWYRGVQLRPEADRTEEPLPD